jgi:hypothetical protein
MKRILLIYSDKNAWTPYEMESCYAESTQLTQELNANGQFLGVSLLHRWWSCLAYHSYK